VKKCAPLAGQSVAYSVEEVVPSVEVHDAAAEHALPAGLGPRHLLMHGQRREPERWVHSEASLASVPLQPALA